ncbi:MAG TPA: PilX N-terminal domain-containing pilus assembly protein [Candidatus Acidoferrum sp.]|nr:PilX N-terminal domain-containing pilus assembly protein [Candidatus Acidoferrum sp.]
MKTMTLRNPARQHGVMMIATLLILLVIGILGMSTVDSSGIEMKMASNNRQQLQAFEAAEFVLSYMEKNLHDNNYFLTNQLTNSSCGSICFTSTCTNGLCFTGTSAYADTPTNGANTCQVGTYDPSSDSTLWANGSGKYKTLSVPYTGLVAKYIIENRCFTSKNSTLAYSSTTNYIHQYRITTLVASEDGRVRVMLRSTIRAI